MACPSTGGGQRCKHLFAVEFIKTVETSADGTTTTTESVKFTKKTFSQDWPRYNAAQVAERETVQALLRGLCDGIETPAHTGRGPKPIPLSDVVFGLVMKTYSTVSGRRAASGIKACETAGEIGRAPAYNTLFTAFGKPEMTEILTSLIEQSAAPLSGVESKFAIDSTGFGTSTYVSWYSAKYGKEMKRAKWLKAHVCVGTDTNIVTSVNVTEGSDHDSPELPALVESTAERFTMGEVSADKAYLSGDNLARSKPWAAVRSSPSRATASRTAQPPGAACTPCSCSERRSSWRRGASGRTSKARSRPSSASLVGPFARRRSPRRRTRFWRRCSVTTWPSSATRCTSLASRPRSGRPARETSAASAHGHGTGARPGGPGLPACPHRIVGAGRQGREVEAGEPAAGACWAPDPGDAGAS